MLAFCWRETDLIDSGTVGACDFDRPYDVAARLFDVALKRLFRRGLNMNYVVVEEVGPRMRGAIDLPRTTRELLHLRGQLASTVDELSEDTPANRLLKAAVRQLVRLPEVDLAIRQRLRNHLGRLGDVRDVSASDALNAQVTAPRYERAYEEALWLARLTLLSLLPDEGLAGDGRSRARRLQERLPQLFEGFIRGAAQHFLATRARVDRPQIDWLVDGASARGLSLVPQMRTDARIAWNHGPPGLVECKFYEAPLATHGRGSQEKFHAGHLYQILSYLHAMSREGTRPTATLVYGSTGTALDEQMTIEGYALRVVWVDLGAAWPVLRDQVLDIVSWRGRPVRDAVPIVV